MAEAPGAGSGTGGEGAGAPPNGGAGGEGAGESKTFTQADLDRQIGERLARERAKYEGFEDLKAKAARLDALEESQKSEIEKAVDKARKDAETAAREETNKTWEDRVKRAEVRVAAAGKLADPEDAVRFLDLSTFKVDDQGNVDTKALSDAIAELVKAKPYLAVNGTRPRTDLDAGPRTPPPGGRSMNDIIRQAAGR